MTAKRSTWLPQPFATLHADHKRIAQGVAWVALFVLIAKVAAAAKEMGIAYRYGISGTVDAYQLALTLVTWLPTTVVSILTVVLIPLLVRLRKGDGHDSALLLRETQGAMLILGALFGVASGALGVLALPYLAKDLSGETQRITSALTLGMVPLAPLTLMIGVHSARLQSRENHANTLLEGLPAVAILCLVLLWPSSQDGSSLLWGTLVGYVVQTAWLGRLAFRADGTSSIPRFSRTSPHWQSLGQLSGVIAVGQFVMGFITPVDQYFAAQVGDSAIATLGYANRVVSLVLGLGALAIARAILPVLSDAVSTGELDRAKHLTRKWSAVMFAAGCVAAVVGWLLAPWGIEILYERGAFTSQDTAAVVSVLRWALLQVPFYFAGLVLVQHLASRSQFAAIGMVAFTNLFVKLALNVALVPLLGIGGIALATGGMYAVSFGTMWVVARSPGGR